MSRKSPQPGPLAPAARRQAAAVCYRIAAGSIEFLLVRTRAGRWTFPKGNLEPGLTLAQSAALEAYEEAGVHGRIEASSFTRYASRKRRPDGSRADLEVLACLCEVAWTETPSETFRQPRWFPPGKAKTCLLKARPPDQGRELSRVIALAVSRIQVRLLPPPQRADARRRVRLEDGEGARSAAVLARHARV